MRLIIGIYCSAFDEFLGKVHGLRSQDISPVALTNMRSLTGDQPYLRRVRPSSDKLMKTS